MRGLQRVPRYQDPLTKCMAGLLVRGLQELHHAPSNTAIELEVRLGCILAHSRSRQMDIPIAFATPAVLDEGARHLYQFQAGVSQGVLDVIQTTLLESGLNIPTFPSVALKQDDVLIDLSNGKRLRCSYHRSFSKTLRSSAETPTASGAAAPMLNPMYMTQVATVLSAQKKERLCSVEMCCPGWSADVRVAVSAETAVPVLLSDATEPTALNARLRARRSFPVGPFFSVQVTNASVSPDVWWYPPPGVQKYMRERDSASTTTTDDDADAVVFGEGTSFPLPALHIQDSTGQSPESRTSSSITYEVEIEVNLRELMRTWKKLYGGAAVSKYLSTAALVETLSGQVPTTSLKSLKPKSLLETGEDDIVVYAEVLAEREDPYLLQVAEELMALTQLLTKVRTVE
ncbi:mRNA capping enzyme, beta chain [Novymonas esmeraldas]|uniref:mRNA 5'-phosphatase n=1 Tax=Novymonas esmeraldas TaxID=1808958 RepID=A0AAW0EQI5_9TRYP